MTAAYLKGGDPPVRKLLKCNTPEKLGFATEEGALEMAGRIRKVGKYRPMRPYECLCGLWHLTKSTRGLPNA